VRGLENKAFEEVWKKRDFFLHGKVKMWRKVSDSKCVKNCHESMVTNCYAP